MAIKVLQPKNMKSGLSVSDDGDVSTENFVKDVVKNGTKLIITLLNGDTKEFIFATSASGIDPVGSVAFAVNLGTGSGDDKFDLYGSAFTKINYRGNKPITNVGGGTWNNSIYNVPADGLYLINASIRTTDRSQTGVNIFQCVDVETYDRPEGIWQTTVGRRYTMQYSRIMQLNQGDTLQHYIYCDGASLSLSGAHFEALKLS